MRRLLDVVLVLWAAEIGLAHALVGGDFLAGCRRRGSRPCAITVMSSAIPNTTSMSCSMITISIVRASSRIFATARSVSAGLMPQVGSSSSSRRGSEISAMPISSSATSPYDSVPAGRSASAVSPICSSVCSTRALGLDGRARRRGTDEETAALPAA